MTDLTLQPRPLDTAARGPSARPPRREAPGLGDVVMVKDPESPRAEAIRALRTHIMAQHIELGRRALVIAAPHAKAGCSFVAANLAVSLAQVGLNTLVIDADMRDPGLDAYFAPRLQDAGLRQSLMEDTGTSLDHIEADYLDNLAVLHAGGQASTPLELLGDNRFPALMDACLRAYDVTIIDTPAANSGADAVRISSVVGYGLIVARDNVTRIVDVETLAKELSVDGVKVVGTVLYEG